MGALIIGAILGISIHAPVKGATNDQNQHHAYYIISIHAPVKGATKKVSAMYLARRGISIHAPVKGATLLALR